MKHPLKMLGLISLFLFMVSFRPAHDYFVSVTQMQYNPAEKILEVSIRLFTDDFEKALSVENGNTRIRLTNNDQNNAIVEKYIRKHFILTDNKRQFRNCNYIGKENEADATWIYLEIPHQGNLSGFSLKNDLLLSAFADQVNIVNVKLTPEKKTYLFKKGKTEQPL